MQTKLRKKRETKSKRVFQIEVFKIAVSKHIKITILIQGSKTRRDNPRKDASRESFCTALVSSLP